VPTFAQPPLGAPIAGFPAPAPGMVAGHSATPYANQADPGRGVAQLNRHIVEKRAGSMPGLLGLLIWLVLAVVALWLMWSGSSQYNGGGLVAIGLILLIIVLFCLTAFTIVQPGDARVIQFFGNYVGTIRETGLRMTYPLTNKRRISVKVRNFETREIKVNDSTGNPVVIAAIIVWQVNDTAEATFAVEYYQQFITVQSEAALRHIATIHPYDNGDPGEPTLRGSTDQVAAELAKEVRDRITIAGLTVVETRISSLSYAPEIASAMLQRQQAEALLAARFKIVEGAVSMVESALKRIEEEDLVALDDERKAAMISNLLVVLCSDSRATPTLNAGSLYNT